MSNYSNTFGGAAKDTAEATVLGADHDTQYEAIATMSATKANKASPSFTGEVDISGTVLVGTASSLTDSNISSKGATSTFAAVFGNSAGSAAYGIGISSATGESVFFYHGGTFGVPVGSIGTSASTTSYSTSSDYRLKENDVPMTGATERVKALRPINFAWKLNGTRVDGFFAHELAEVVPEATTGTKDAMRDEKYEVTPAVFTDEGVETKAAVIGTRSVPDMQGIDQAKLVPLLTATIQELITRIEALES
jgi:hypothetical protein